MGRAVIARVVEQLETLPENLQRKVLAFVETLQPVEHRGVAGEELLEFAGTIPVDDLDLMRQAIEDGCEQVDLNEW